MSQIGNFEHRLTLGDVLALDNVLSGDDAADGREDRDVMRGHAPGEDVVDLFRRDPPAGELLPGVAHHLPLAPEERAAEGALGRGTLLRRSLGEEELLDGLVEFGAVELGERLAGLHRVAGEVDVQLLEPGHPPGLRRDPREPPLVEGDGADRGDGLGKRGVGDLARLDSGLGHPHRAEGEPGDDARRERLLLADLPLRQRHPADGAAPRLRLDDRRVHRAVVFDVGRRGVGLARRAGPLLVVVPDRVPIAEDQACRGHDRDEAEPELDDLHHHPELLPPRERRLGRSGRSRRRPLGKSRMRLARVRVGRHIDHPP